jgi:hypothetical protein
MCERKYALLQFLSRVARFVSYGGEPQQELDLGRDRFVCRGGVPPRCRESLLSRRRISPLGQTAAHVITHAG